MSSLPVQGTLLIVDDERAGREALEGLLLNQGYRLHFATGGAEAMTAIRQMRPDLVLLDVMMPGMDGFEVCRQLRADPLTAEIAVLLVTALDDRETRLEGISAGADDFISKPYDRGELRLRVKTIMRIGRYRRLLNERARFNSVVENASNGYIVVKDDGSISYANGSARSFSISRPPASWPATAFSSKWRGNSTGWSPIARGRTRTCSFPTAITSCGRRQPRPAPSGSPSR